MRRYRVTGRVQGVGFRWFVRECARELGLAGCVRNEPDGSVIVDAAGLLRDVMSLEDALARGPRGADVDGVAVVLDGDEAQRVVGVFTSPFAIQR
jgi:acylphosphatase